MFVFEPTIEILFAVIVAEDAKVIVIPPVEPSKYMSL